MDLTSIKHTVKISTNSSTTYCATCQKTVSHFDDMSGLINHLIADHGYVLLHVGGEWGHDQDGKSIQHTVAILGSQEPAPPEPQVEFRIGGIEVPKL
jgi:hypothetical protein